MANGGGIAFVGTHWESGDLWAGLSAGPGMGTGSAWSLYFGNECGGNCQPIASLMSQPECCSLLGEVIGAKMAKNCPGVNDLQLIRVAWGLLLLLNFSCIANQGAD